MWPLGLESRPPVASPGVALPGRGAWAFLRPPAQTRPTAVPTVTPRMPGTAPTFPPERTKSFSAVRKKTRFNRGARNLEKWEGESRVSGGLPEGTSKLRGPERRGALLPAEGRPGWGRWRPLPASKPLQGTSARPRGLPAGRAAQRPAPWEGEAYRSQWPWSQSWTGTQGRELDTWLTKPPNRPRRWSQESEARPCGNWIP